MSLIIRDGPAADGHVRSDAPRVARWQELSSHLRRALVAMQSAVEWNRERRALGELDDHLLRDIGLTRMDVRCERTRPMAPAGPAPVQGEAGHR